MSDEQKLPTAEVAGFMEYWKRHPLSTPIIIVTLYLSFLLILLQGGLKDNRLDVAYFTGGFCLFIFIVVMAILVGKKSALYNSLDVIISEIEHCERQDSLGKLQIGVGAAFEDLRLPP